MGRCPPLGGEPGDGDPLLAHGRRGSDVAAGEVLLLGAGEGAGGGARLRDAGGGQRSSPMRGGRPVGAAGRADELARAIVSSATELDHDACIDPIEARLEAAIDARLSGRVPEVGTAIAGATKGAKGVRS